MARNVIFSEALIKQMQRSQLEQLPRWQRGLLLALSVICAIIFLAFLSEAAVRVRPWIKTGVFWGNEFWGTDRTYMIDPHTGLRVLIPNGHFGPVHINSYGFRSPELTLDKPTGRLRIAFIGGSTTYCGEVSSDQMTWPYLVVAAIKDRYPDLDIDFINGGVPGYTTTTLKPYLEKKIAPFHPDVIVIYEATNDLSVNSFALAREQGVTDHNQEKSMGWLAQHSLLAYLVEKNLKVLLQQHPVLAEETQPKVLIDQARLDDMYRRDLTALVEASKKVAGLVVTVTFAPRLRSDQTPAELRAAAITSLYYMPFMTPEAILQGFQRYNDIMRSVAAEERTLLVGNEEAIPADAAHYKDSVHFTDAGSIAMAKRVADALLNSPQFQVLALEHQHGATVATSPAQ